MRRLLCRAALFIAPVWAATADLQTGLVGYWQFDEGTGAGAYDSSGYGNDGAVLGAVWTNGMAGAALWFTPTNYVFVTNAPSLNPTSNITVAAWIYATSWPGNNRVLQKGGNDNQYRLTCEYGSFKFHLSGVNNGTVTMPLPSVGAWHHVAGTYDGSNLRFYLDGMQIAQQTASGLIATSIDNLGIGDKPGSGNPVDFFNGIIDDVRVYGLALTSNQVVELYSSFSCTCQINGPGTVCSQSTDNTYTSLVGSGATLGWAIDGNGTISGPTTGQFVSVTAGDGGTFTLALTVSSANCTSVCSQIVTISTNPPPSAIVSGDATICAGNSTLIQAALSGTPPWQLSWSDGVTQSNILSSPATRSVGPSTTTVYSVTTVSDASCIGAASGSAIITVSTRPTAAVSGGGAVCIGASTNIQATLTGVAPWNITWSDGFIQSGITTSPVTRAVSPVTNTIYTITAISDANCTGTATGSAAVTVKYPPAITSQPSSVTKCVSEPVTFTVTAVNTNGIGGASSGLSVDNQPSGASQTTNTISGSVNFRSDRILVKPKKGITALQVSSQHAVLGAQVERTFAAIGDLQIVKLPPGLTVEEAIARYQQSGLVEYAEPDYEVQAVLTPNDPRYLDGTLWAMNNTGQNGGTADADIDAPEGWDTRTSADPVIVAVIDTGVRYTHEDLAANMWTNPGEIPGNGIDDDGNGYVDDVYGINALTNTGDPWDDHFHGTHVSGTIGGIGNNGKGVVGVAWTVRIMACKFLNSGGFGSTSDAIKCIDYARSKGAKIMSNSWGGGGYSSALRDAIIAARNADIIFVAAAGNYASNNDISPTYPASYDVDNIVAVAATDRNDGLASFSNYGAGSVELGAPGVDIYSSFNTSDSSYGTLNGTSMATPHVAGALALFRAQFPDLSYSEAIADLVATVDPIPSLTGKTVSGGRLNLHKFLTHRDPMVYQWRKDGVDIPNATNSTYTIPSVTFGDAGTYAVVVANACGPTFSSNAMLTVTSCGILAVTPTNGFSSSGPVGGTFTPSSQTFMLQNIGAISLTWQASNSADWLSLSATGGTLAASASTNIVLLINTNANNLTAGGYLDSVAFVNLSNGRGTTNRIISLSVTGTNGGLVACYPFNGNANDASGNGNHGTVVGATFETNNPPGRMSLRFAGNSSSYVVVPRSSSLEPTNGLSISMWCKGVPGQACGAGWGTILRKANSCTAGYFFKGCNTSSFYIDPPNPCSTGGAKSANFAPFTGTNWQHVVGTYSVADGLLRAYEHGVLINQVPYSNPLAHSGSLYIGGANVASDDGGFNGLIYDVRIYNRALSAAEVQQLYDSGKASLSVSPSSGLDSSGDVGGPFNPSSRLYTLTNSGNDTLSWTASVSDGWLGLTATNGTLASGAATNVTITINSVANDLPGGLYSNVVSFFNLNNGNGNTNRIATLLVRDGIPDAWRLYYFGHVDPRANDRSRAQDDADGDGLSNLSEFLAGNDPTNAASAFRILGVTLSSNDVSIVWTTTAGRTNVVQYAPSLDAGYSNLSPSIIIPGESIPGASELTTNYLDIRGATNDVPRFYRIRLVP